jgi:uncharacterized iron-regulated membrane protein
MLKPAFRNYVLQLHRWTALTIGLMVVLIAVTGAAVVFRPQLEPILNPDLLTVPACSARVPLDTLTVNARAAHAEGDLDYIRIMAAEESDARIPAARIRFTDQVFVYLDPCTGNVLGERARYGGFLASIEQLHIFRFTNERSLITPVSAIVFGIVLIAGGVFLWWPGKGRSVRASLRLPAQASGRVRLVQLHKIVGVFTGAVLMMLVLTGLPLSFDWYRNGLYTLTGSPLPEKFPKSNVAAATPKRLPMEAIWQKAQAVVTNWAEVLMHYPGKPDAPVDMYVIERGAPHANARTLLFLDAYGGGVLRHTPYSASSLGHKLYFWTISFHTGQFGGVPGQLLLLAGALGVPVLAYTGIAGWLRRRSVAASRSSAAVFAARTTHTQETP